VDDDVIADLHEAPTGFRVLDPDGNASILPIPASVSDGAYLRMDYEGHVDTSDGFITFIHPDTGEIDAQIAIDEGVTLAAANAQPVIRSLLLEEDDYAVEDAKRKNSSNRVSLTGNLTFNVLDNARIRMGARYYDGEAIGNPGDADVVLNHREETVSTTKDYQLFGTWTHYLSNNTFYQLQVDYSVNNDESWDPDIRPSAR
jgi:hypothetical protein